MRVFGGQSIGISGMIRSVDQSGFSPEFFDEYHKVHPRSEPYYEERQKLYQLYHHLNVSLSRISLVCPSNDFS